MKLKQLPQNLLSETWVDLDSDELRLFLRERFAPDVGQYDGDDGKLYLPLAGAQSRIALTYDGNEIVAVEPGEAFDATEWEKVSQEIERSILTGTPKTGRDYSFSLFPVQGSWLGRRSQVQILPAPGGAPRAAGALDPFILEFPIKGSDLPFITNHRRIREHRKVTLLLNALLAGRTSCLLQRSNHFWASLSPDEGKPGRWRKLFATWRASRVVAKICGAIKCRSRIDRPWPNIKWVQEWYYAPLDTIVLDGPSPPTVERLEEIEPEEYYTKVGNDGRGLRVPADLDESICRYLGLSPGDKAKFDRATFWLDMFSRQWNISASAAFAALVSAIEALTERGIAHQFNCPICGGPTQHEVPGATRRFKDFVDAYASGTGSASKDEMYALRSGILHGSKLIEIDYALAFGWDPPWWNQRELLWDLSTITRIALRNWLKGQSPLAHFADSSGTSPRGSRTAH
jgi:hypothetical protein